MAAPFSKAAPSCKLVFEKSNFAHIKSAHKRTLDKKYFIHNATIILPFNSSLPKEIESVGDQQLQCLVKRVPLHHLIDKEFVEAFVKKGSLYILSYGTKIDTQDCVALLPTGHLVLNLSKDTYEQLGLEGKPSHFTFQKPGKYVVDVDLTPDYFCPGRKRYERVLWCLKDRLDQIYDLLVSWIPHDDKICPSSVQRFFENKGLEIIPAPLRMKTRWVTSLAMPVINSAITTEREESCGPSELWEWLGAVACGVDMSEAASDNYISTLACPSPSVNCPRCGILQVSGFLTPLTAHWLLNKIRSEVERSENGNTWANITFHGFVDTPVSVESREHGFFHEGDNLHSFVIFPNKDYWLYAAFGYYDLCQ